MKKFVALMCIMAMGLSLIACGSESTPTDTTTKVETAEAVTETTTTEEVEEPEAEPVVDFEELIVVDDENCVFAITGVDPKGTWGYTIKARCENKKDVNMMFSWENVSVNGIMADPFWASEVASGKKSNEDISFMSSTLKDNGIDEIRNIEFELRIYNSEDWMEDPYVEEIFTFYADGRIEKGSAEGNDSADANGAVVVDNDTCSFSIIGVDPDGDWGYTVKAHCVNKTDCNLLFSWDNVSVNGYMVDPFWATEVASGKQANVDISFLNSELEENGITDVESIEYTLRVTNSDEWLDEPYVEETFTLTP